KYPKSSNNPVAKQTEYEADEPNPDPIGKIRSNKIIIPPLTNKLNLNEKYHEICELYFKHV
ncbi:15494_t:CDS:1, partial [Gigaspora rosea]